VDGQGTMVGVYESQLDQVLLLSVVGLWSVNAAAAWALVGWRRSRGMPLSTRLWVLAAASWAAVPGVLPIGFGRGMLVYAASPGLEWLGIALAVGLSLVAASVRLAEGLTERHARRAAGLPATARRLHWAWSAAAALACGTVAVRVSTMAVGEVTGRQLLVWLVLVPLGAATAQAWRRRARDREIVAALSQAGLAPALPGAGVAPLDVLRRHLAVTRRSVDRPVGPGRGPATVGRATCAVVGAAVLTGLLVLRAIMVVRYPEELAVVTTVAVMSTFALLAAAAPQVLNGVRTALRQPHPTPGPLAGPGNGRSPEPDPT
jgi:hypothetical protein